MSILPLDIVLPSRYFRFGHTKAHYEGKHLTRRAYNRRKTIIMVFNHFGVLSDDNHYNLSFEGSFMFVCCDSSHYEQHKFCCCIILLTHTMRLADVIPGYPALILLFNI